MNIRKFLWQGGTTNTSKHHLVNCAIVRNLKDRGGLGIKYLVMMNSTLGAMLLWHMVVDDPHWWKNVLWKKYFIGSR
jgi:hypothetical protein